MKRDSPVYRVERGEPIGRAGKLARVRSVVVFTLALALAAGPARAEDDLARARRLEAQLEYEPALAIVEGALRRGGAEPARTVELHLLAGRLAAGLDRAAAAEA